MEVTVENLTLTRVIYSNDTVAVYEAKVSGYSLPVAVRVTHDTDTSQGDEFKMAQLLSKLGSNFVQVYGELTCVGSKYLFDVKPEKVDSKYGIVIKPEIAESWGGSSLPPICYDKPVSATATVTSYNGEVYTTHPKQYKAVPLRYMVMEYIPSSQLKKMPLVVQGSILLQVACALQIASTVYGFDHNDLHPGNILLRPTDAKDKTYPELDVIVPLVGWEAVIIDCEYGRMTRTTPVLIGSKLASEHDVEPFLPSPPASAPHHDYTDLGFLWSVLFEYTKTVYDLFFGVHGLKNSGITGRVVSIAIPFSYMDFIAFVRDPVVYLQAFSTKPENIALIQSL